MRVCVVGLSVSFCTRFSVASLASLFFAVLFFSVERGEETRGRTKWPRGADTVRELAARRQHMHQPAAPSHCRGGLVIVRETIAVMYCGRQKLAFESCLF